MSKIKIAFYTFEIDWCQIRSIRFIWANNWEISGSAQMCPEKDTKIFQNIFSDEEFFAKLITYTQNFSELLHCNVFNSKFEILVAFVHGAEL